MNKFEMCFPEDSGWIREFKQRLPDPFTQFMGNFKRSMMGFYEGWEQIAKRKKRNVRFGRSKFHSIELPFEMTNFLQEKIQSIEEFEGDDIEDYFEELTVHGEKLRHGHAPLFYLP